MMKTIKSMKKMKVILPNRSISDNPDRPNSSSRSLKSVNPLKANTISNFIKQSSEEENYDFLKFTVLNTKVLNNYESYMMNMIVCTIGELALIVISIVLLLTQNILKYYLFALLIHVPKGILGIVILNKLPCASSIINNIKQNDNKITYIIETINSDISEYLKGENNNFKINTVLLPYLIITIFSVCVEVALFIFEMWLFNNSGNTNFQLYNLLEWIILWIFFIM